MQWSKVINDKYSLETIETTSTLYYLLSYDWKLYYEITIIEFISQNDARSSYDLAFGTMGINFRRIWQPLPVLSLHSSYENHNVGCFASCFLVSSVTFKGQQRSWFRRRLYSSGYWHWKFPLASLYPGTHDIRRNSMGSYEKLAYQRRYPEEKAAKKEAPIHLSLLNHCLWRNS